MSVCLSVCLVFYVSSPFIFSISLAFCLAVCLCCILCVLPFFLLYFPFLYVCLYLCLSVFSFISYLNVLHFFILSKRSFPIQNGGRPKWLSRLSSNIDEKWSNILEAKSQIKYLQLFCCDSKW